MLFLYRYFSGVLLVEFFGIYPEKLLNLCAKNGINIWSARYINQKIRAKILARDFIKLRKILRKSGIKVHIIQKNGFPFFIRKYNKRLGFLIGLVIFFFFLQVMSGYIWIIEVKGNKTVSESQIVSACNEIGIKEGIKKNKISAKADAQELLLKLDKLAWGSLNIEGCRLTVNVTEIVEKTEDNSVASNLKASEDGVITHIHVTSGNCLVKVGDIVSKGDILVSGIIENESGTKFVHSMGNIIAETETQIILEEKLSRQELIPTGKQKTKHVLNLFGVKIPLYMGRENNNYTAESSESTLKLFSQKLPIKLYSKRFIFNRIENIEIDYPKAIERLEERLLNEHKGTVKNKEITQNDNSVILSAVLVEKKNIALSENLILGIGN